jgi:hypothetical protein
LVAVARLVERHGMQVNPASGGCDDLDSDRSPVGLDDITQLTKRIQGHGLSIRRNRHIQVAVSAGLEADEGINAPSTADPSRTAGGVKGVEYRVHLISMHFRSGEHVDLSSVAGQPVPMMWPVNGRFARRHVWTMPAHETLTPVTHDRRR